MKHAGVVGGGIAIISIAALGIVQAAWWTHAPSPGAARTDTAMSAGAASAAAPAPGSPSAAAASARPQASPVTTLAAASPPQPIKVTQPLPNPAPPAPQTQPFSSQSVSGPTSALPNSVRHKSDPLGSTDGPCPGVAAGGTDCHQFARDHRAAARLCPGRRAFRLESAALRQSERHGRHPRGRNRHHWRPRLRLPAFQELRLPARPRSRADLRRRSVARTTRRRCSRRWRTNACRATFFPIGKHATYHPEILKQVIAAGNTVGSHTWSHADLLAVIEEERPGRRQGGDRKGRERRALMAGAPIAPFFRFPDLRHPPEMVTYLGERNVAIFSTDLNSFDFKIKKPGAAREIGDGQAR